MSDRLFRLGLVLALAGPLVFVAASVWIAWDDYWRHAGHPGAVGEVVATTMAGSVLGLALMFAQIFRLGRRP